MNWKSDGRILEGFQTVSRTKEGSSWVSLGLTGAFLLQALPGFVSDQLPRPHNRRFSQE
jgi:hypothetical protein